MPHQIETQPNQGAQILRQANARMVSFDQPIFIAQRQVNFSTEAKREFCYGKNGSNQTRPESQDRDETKATMLLTEQRAQESDDQLTITLDGKTHLVDSIVQFKKTLTGISQFRLEMYCECCVNRTFWFSMSKLVSLGCSGLQELACQVEELYMEGVDIQSQKTNE